MLHPPPLKHGGCFLLLGLRRKVGSVGLELKAFRAVGFEGSGNPKSCSRFPLQALVCRFRAESAEANDAHSPSAFAGEVSCRAPQHRV